MQKGNPELNKKRGEIVKTCRQRANMTQKELADKIPCSPMLISSIEKGRRGLTEDMAKRIGDVLGRDPDYLLFKIPIDPNSEFLDAIADNVKHSPTSQIIYDLIKAHPDCRGIRWSLDRAGASWDIEAIMLDVHNMDTEDLEYIHIKLDYNEQLKLFESLLDYIGPRLYRYDNDRQFLANWHFDFLDGGGEILDKRIIKDLSILKQKKVEAVAAFHKKYSDFNYTIHLNAPDQREEENDENE